MKITGGGKCFFVSENNWNCLQWRQPQWQVLGYEVLALAFKGSLTPKLSKVTVGVDVSPWSIQTEMPQTCFNFTMIENLLFGNQIPQVKLS